MVENLVLAVEAGEPELRQLGVLTLHAEADPVVLRHHGGVHVSAVLTVHPDDGISPLFRRDWQHLDNSLLWSLGRYFVFLLPRSVLVLRYVTFSFKTLHFVPFQQFELRSVLRS